MAVQKGIIQFMFDFHTSASVQFGFERCILFLFLDVGTGPQWLTTLLLLLSFLFMLFFSLNSLIHLHCSSLRPSGFYRAMHFSAERGLAIACRLSVRLSVCNVGGL